MEHHAGLDRGNGGLSSTSAPSHSMNEWEETAAAYGLPITWCRDSVWPGVPSASMVLQIALFLVYFLCWECSPSFTASPQICRSTLGVRNCVGPDQHRASICLFFHTINKAVIYEEMTEEAQKQMGGWRKVFQSFTCKWSCRLASERRVLIGNPGPGCLNSLRMRKKWRVLAWLDWSRIHTHHLTLS